MSTESAVPSNHLILSCPSPPTFNLVQHQGFSSESDLHIWWPKYWSYIFNINPSNKYPGLISFRTDWLDLFAVQGTLKSLLQHHSSNVSILQCSGFFIAQLSHPYMTTGKTTASTRRTFIDKVMSLLFNVLPRLVILEKEMETHSSILAWEISWTEEPSRLWYEVAKSWP